MRTKKLTNLVLAVVCAAGFTTTAKAADETAVDKPFIVVTPIYQDGVTKDANSKSLIDFAEKQHQYIGVTIGCERTVYEFSGNCYITDGKGHYMSPELAYDGRTFEEMTADTLFDIPSKNIEYRKIINDENKFFQSLSKGTFYSTETPNEAMEWKVEKHGNYYTIYSPYKKGYLAIMGSDPRMYLTPNLSDEYTRWYINENSQIYQYRDNMYMALHFNADPNTNYCQYVQIEKNGNITDENVRKTQIIPIRAAVFKSYSNGVLDTDDIIKAIKSKFAENNNQYAYTPGSAKDLCKGLLYVDMSGLKEVTNTGNTTWSDFQKEVAANCLFFVPATYTNTYNGKNEIVGLSKNVVAKNSDDKYEARTNFVLTDIDTNYGDGYTNPFYSPYTFDVYPYKDKNGVDVDPSANYIRKMGSSQTQSSTIILPFGVEITNGVSKYGVVFYAAEDEGATSQVQAQVNSGIIVCKQLSDNISKTTANKPYLVKMANSGDLNIDIEQTRTTVEATQVCEYANIMGAWTAYGNYFGKRQQKSIVGGTQYYYYNNGMYLNSSFNSKSYFYADPYRVYFTPTVANSSLNGKSYQIFFEGYDESETATEIESATADETATTEVIYTLSGVKVNGKPQQHGIYIVNGKKKMF